MDIKRKYSWSLIFTGAVIALAVIGAVGLLGQHSKAAYISKAHLFVETYLPPNSISWCGNDTVTNDGAGDHIVTGCVYSNGSWGKRARYDYRVAEDGNMNINKDLSSLRMN